MNFKLKHSISVICIVATEFCERFSFCGLRTILSIYLRNELLYSENTATVLYHVFIMVCYMVPILGAICADSYIGRYRTILYFSLIYLTGNIVMCIAAVPIWTFGKAFYTTMGLVLISVGTGGIKPCVAAFGGDQFYLPDQEDELQHFFGTFYFSINLGSFMGTILTPILRKWVTCFGEETCYPLGFGFPAILMFFSIVLFMLGKPWYRLKTPKENVIIQFLKCAVFALGRKMKDKERKEDHWLDYSAGEFSGKLVGDMKIVCSVLFLFIPLPIFWSLYDQQGSRWTFQASHMDGNVMGAEIIPDQMQVVNPAIVITMIPFFDTVLYPYLAKGGLLGNSLHRMSLGGLLAGLAFMSAAALEMVLEKTYPELPDKHHASMFFVNTLPCTLTILNPFNEITYLMPGELTSFKNVEAHNFTKYPITVKAVRNCGNLELSADSFKAQIEAVEGQVDTIIIGVDADNNIKVFITDPIDFKKSLTGRPRVRVAYIRTSQSLQDVTLTLKGMDDFEDTYFVPNSSKSSLAASDYMEVPQGLYQCIVKSKGHPMLFQTHVYLAFGGVYTLVVREYHDEIEFMHLYAVSAPNIVNILWQLPQYFLISLSEIMFAIAGLEFSFLQAPKSMKTVTIAGWYLSVAVGNLLVIIITQANLFKSQAYEFLLFAVLIVADMMIFTEMASNYKFVQLEADSSIHYFREEQVPLKTDVDD